MLITYEMAFGDYRKCNRGRNCLVLIRWATMPNRQALPIDQLGVVHLHKNSEYEKVVFTEGYGRLPSLAQCGCGGTVAIPLPGREARLDSASWPWKAHKCKKTSEYWDNGGLEFLLRRCEKFAPAVELGVLFGVQKLRSQSRQNKIFAVGLKTAHGDVHCGLVQDDSIPEVGSLLGWHINADKRHIMISSGGQEHECIRAGITPRNFGFDN
jgi:hypothetical protein